MTRTSDTVRAELQARRAVLEREVAALKARSARLSSVRGALVLALVATGIATYVRDLGVPGYAAMGVLLLGFIALVVRHALVASDELAKTERTQFVDGCLARLAGELDPNPDGGDRFRAKAHPYADDLDVFGPRSLYRLLCRARTGPGQATIASWLSEPATTEVVHERQAAARELAGRGELLEELAQRARTADARGQDADPLVAWAEGPAELPLPGQTSSPDVARLRPWIVVARILVPLTLLGLVMSQIDVPGPSWLARAWLAPFIVQGLCLARLYMPLSRLVQVVSSREAPFGRYRRLFELIETAELESSRLVQRRAILVTAAGGVPASRAIAQLERIISFADLRHNTVVHFVANIFLLWDLWCALALERWRTRSGPAVRAWLEAVGEVEALASLGMLTRERPSWVFPEITHGAPQFSAEALTHPLLPPASAVTNDVELVAADGETPPGYALLVTGSNMSGKSTYLRAIGVGAVLALAGAPVPATRLTLSPLRTWTSMRIRDDLADGVSHFYAELARLKQVVDATDAAPDVLFLLDEILHGTNSRERIIGARHVVMRLVGRGAIGCVSSHDLGLSDLDRRCGGRVRNVHFRETVDGDRMTFDHRLREGVVDTSNALRLMRGLGLDVPLDGEDEPVLAPEA